MTSNGEDSAYFGGIWGSMKTSTTRAGRLCQSVQSWRTDAYSWLGAVSRCMLRVREPRALCEAVCRLAVEQGGFHMAWIGLLDPEIHAITVAAQAGATVDLPPLRLGVTDGGSGDQDPIGALFGFAEHVVVNDVGADSGVDVWHEIAVRAGCRACVALPLIIAGRARGALSLYAAEPACFDDDALRQLGEMAADLGLALEHAEQEQRHRQVEKQLAQMKRLYATLSQVNQMIVRVRDRDALFQGICDIATRHGEFALAWIGLPVDATGDLVPVAASSLDVTSRPFSLVNSCAGALKDEPAATALRTSRVAVTADVQGGANAEQMRNQIGSLAYHASAAVPFHLRGKPVGALTLISREMGFFSSDEEVRLLEEMGLDISFALDTIEAEGDRRAAEEKLRESECRLKRFIELAPAAVAMLDRDMRYIAASRRWLADYRLADADITGRSHYEVFPEISESWKEIHRRCLAGAVERATDDPFLRADGTLDWVRWEVHPWYEMPGEIGGIILYTEVITGRRQAEKELQASEAHYRTLIECSSSVIATIDIDGYFHFGNAVAASQLGCSPGDIVGKHMSDFFAADVAEYHVRQIRRVLESNEGLIEESETVVNGQRHFYLNNIQPIRDASGQTALAMLNAQDITDLKRAEEQLRRSEERFRTVFEQAPFAMAMYTPDGAQQRVNRAWENLLGVTAEQWRTFNILDDTRTRTTPNLQQVERIFVNGEAAPLLPEFYDPGDRGLPGRSRWIEGSMYPVRDAAGALSEVVLMLRDITEARQAAATRARLAAVVETSEDAIIGITADRIIETWNRGATRLLGYDAAEAVGQPVTMLLPREPHAGLPPGMPFQELGGHIAPLETELVHKTGSAVLVSVTVAPLVDADGVPGAAAIVRDISARVRAQKMLEKRVKARTRELESLLEISRVVASTLELGPLMDLLLDRLQELVGYKTARIISLEGSGGPPKLLALRHGGATMPPAGLVDHVLPSLRALVAGRKPVFVADLHRDERPLVAAFRRAFAEHKGFLPAEYVSWMMLPLLLGDRVLGFITLTDDRRGRYSARDADLGVLLASQAAVAIENATLYARAREVAVLEERGRLARELHDSVTQMLFSAGLITEVLPQLWDRDPMDAKQHLGDLQLLVRGALAEMRALLLELRPAALTDVDLGGLLRSLSDATTGRTRLPVTLTVDGRRLLPPDVQVALYRIAQEALTNATKHAGASALTVSLRYMARDVELRIGDDGTGFDPTAVGPEHLGLRIMAERASQVGATLAIESTPGNGTMVTLRWIGPAVEEV